MSSYWDVTDQPPAERVAIDDDEGRAELAAAIGAVIEGQCPEGHGPLERRREAGWCATCGLGWWVRMCRGGCVWCAKPCGIKRDSPVIGSIDPRGHPMYPLLVPRELERLEA